MKKLALALSILVLMCGCGSNQPPPPRSLSWRLLPPFPQHRPRTDLAVHRELGQRHCEQGRDVERHRAGMRRLGVRNIYQRYLHLGNLHRSGVGFSQFKCYGDGNLRGPTDPVPIRRPSSSCRRRVSSPPICPSPRQLIIYYTDLQATGGVQPLNWSLASGTLPAGMTLNSAGIILWNTHHRGHLHFHCQSDGFIGGAGWRALNATNL